MRMWKERQQWLSRSASSTSARFLREDNPTDYLYIKVRPFSEEFKARLVKSRDK